MRSQTYPHQMKNHAGYHYMNYLNRMLSDHLKEHRLHFPLSVLYSSNQFIKPKTLNWLLQLYRSAPVWSKFHVHSSFSLKGGRSANNVGIVFILPNLFVITSA